MLGLQEIQDKAAVGIRSVRRALDSVNSDHGWCPEDASIYEGMSRADAKELKETLDSLSLSQVLQMVHAKETLVKDSSNAGTDVLVAAKLHDTLLYAVKDYDICDRIGYVVGPWEGGDLKLDITKDNGLYRPRRFSGGGKIMEVNAQFVQNTIAPIGYGIPILVGESLIEDEAYDVVQWHVENAAKAVGKQATDLALKVLVTGTGGDGTVNTGNGDSGQSKIIGGTEGTNDIIAGLKLLGDDEFNANTMVCLSHAWAHSLSTSTGTAGWHPTEPTLGYQMKVGILDVLLSTSPSLHAAADIQGATMTACKTAVFDRNNALMTGRKRWMELKNFSDPINDIGGAVVSFRQNSACLYNDSIFIMTET